MRKFRTRRPVVLLAVLALLLVAGCGGDDDGGSGGGGSADTIKEGTLTVGSDIPYAPFEFGRPPEYEGFDIDLVNEIGKRLELKVEFQKAAFDTIFRNLAQGRFDMVASATTITPERDKIVDFSDPYFQADQSLMVKKGSDIKSDGDLTEENVVGAQTGTTGAQYANNRTPARVRTYEQIDDAFNALQAGQVDAVINDFPISKYAERSKPQLRVVQTIVTGENYGLALNSDSDGLREAVNRALRRMKEDGTYTRIYRKWFEFHPPTTILATPAE